jgi:peroxiredoxin
LEKALKMAISQCNEIDLIVIVDVNESRTISAWYPLIAQYQRVVFFSLVDIDFSHTIQP